MVTYSARCDMCSETWDMLDSPPEISAVRCSACDNEYCEACPEKLKQCQECGELYCSCTVVTSVCEHCEEDKGAE